MFAIEANQPECRAINDYVLRGIGDPRAALDGIYFWTWNTEEVLALIEWMRAWNADSRHPRKVQFLGFDMQTSKVAYASVAAFLRKVAPDAAPGLLAPIEALGDNSARAVGASAVDQKRITDGLAVLAKVFDADRRDWLRTTSAAELEEVRHDLTILAQATELYIADATGGSGLNVRDRSMAVNIEWVLAHQPPGTRIVVWAHNTHVANRLGDAGLGLENMGGHLRKRFKAGYVNLGLEFSHGSFQAMRSASGLDEITLGEPPESHASVAFVRTGKPLLVLDLRSLPARGLVHDWFVAPHPVREIGPMFYDERAMTPAQILPELYDAVMFVARTTRARPNHGAI